MGKTSDKTVYKTTGWCGFGSGSNTAAVDVKDGRIARIRPNVISQDHGARVDSIVTGLGGLDRGGANNLICPNATTSKNAPGEVTNGFLVNIEKVDVAALAEQYPEQFSRDYDADCGMVASARIVKA